MYRTKEKGYDVISEKLKQRVIAIKSKLGKHEYRKEQFRQNRSFDANHEKEIRELDVQMRLALILDAEKIKAFWDQPEEHNDEAEWLHEVQDRLRII